MVRVNGKSVGNKGGYVGFKFDITDYALVLTGHN